MRTSLLLTALLAGLAATGAASAGTITGNDFQVSATVAESCIVVSDSNISFGTYDPLNASATNASGDIVLRCVNGTVGDVKLGEGQNGGGTCNRQMASGANRLPYAIYQNPGRTTAWDCTTGQAFTATSSGSNIILTTYGQIPAGQDVPLGAYTDVVAYEVTF